MQGLWLIPIVAMIVWLTLSLFNRRRSPVWRLLVILPLLASVLLICSFAAVAMFGMRRSHHALGDPATAFAKHTGLAWPESAKVVAAGDNHSGEGELHVIFDVQPADFDRLLNGAPPWSIVKWQPGPVPPKIGFHCQFGTSGVAMTKSGNQPASYSGDARLVELLGSHDVRYVASERCCKSLRWHNGSLLVLDAATHRVWLSVWDW